ncbi:MAG TPA: hypothetical protein VKS21_12770 [Spirochaetota bacterium]|nr:hypothetical protein [Spirochaetota bacterium]
MKLISRLVLVSCLFFTCYKGDTFRYRLDKFYSLLGNEEITAAFKKGEIAAVSSYIDEQTAKDKAFKKKYLNIKKFEAINHFSTEQTVVFFYKYFYLKLHPEKRK